MLVGQRGQVFVQDQLVEWLFPALVADKVLQNLHARISELRKVLEPTLQKGTESQFILSVGKGRYQFNPKANCQVDVDAFWQRVEAANSLVQAQQWTEAALAYQQAAILYQGHYLAEDPYEEWAIAPRRMWKKRYLNVLAQLAECFAQQGKYTRAVEQLESALGIAPSVERFYRQLMRYHALAGERAQVQKVYAACTQALAQTLQVEPDRQTQQLHAQLLRDTGTPKPLKTIAVLPFLHLSSRQAHTYFSDGLTDDIIAQLAKIRDLKVISRTSAMRYKHTTKDLGTIGHELGVGTILEGSVRSHGNQIRVSAQLVDVTTDTPLWSESYDRQLTDIFAIQSDLAYHIAQALESRVTGAEKSRIERAPTAHLEAYRCYLKGRYFWNKRKPGDLDKAIGFFKQAITYDPNYATAHQWYGEYLSTLGHHEQAVASLRTALELDPLSLVINTVLAWKLYFAGALKEAEAQCLKALELDPHFGPGLTVMGWIYEGQGHYQDALDCFRQEIRLSGETAPSLSAIGYVHAKAGAPDNARCVLEQLLAQSQVSHFHVATVHIALGELNEAFCCLKQALKQRAWVLVYLNALKRFDPLRGDPRFAKLLQQIGILS